MKSILTASTFVLAATLAAPLSAADKDPNLKAIKARQGEMQMRAFNAGPLFAMAKGDMDYDAKLAQTLADNLAALAGMDHSRMWPQGSGKDKYPGKTTATNDIWSTYPKIAEAGKKYGSAVSKLSADAGKGLDALRGAVGPLGKSCKGCHDDFREKD